MALGTTWGRARDFGRRAAVAIGAAMMASTYDRRPLPVSQRLERCHGQRARHGRRRDDDAGGVLERLADNTVGQVRRCPCTGERLFW
ncbi:MAG: hypothetical protein V9G21_00810 [Methylotenera sp.]